MKIRLTIGLLVILVVCLIGIVLWHAHNRDVLPPIKDAEKLHKDCLLLCEKFPLDPFNISYSNNVSHTEFYNKVFRLRAGQMHIKRIPKESWPDSIVQLRPFEVYRDEYAVCICIKKNAHPGGPSIDIKIAARNWLVKGYYVHTNPTEAPPRSATHGSAQYFLYETGYHEIDEFRVPVAVL